MKAEIGVLCLFVAALAVVGESPKIERFQLPDADVGVERVCASVSATRANSDADNAQRRACVVAQRSASQRYVERIANIRSETQTRAGQNLLWCLDLHFDKTAGYWNFVQVDECMAAAALERDRSAIERFAAQRQ